MIRKMSLFNRFSGFIFFKVQFSLSLQVKKIKSVPEVTVYQKFAFSKKKKL